ncbi:hypothetical protein QR680_007168 [Steinernema hermaphroditum]|uniref:Secreted protein n=1 Tax=Steinernema hermaphroditum TaxID=289476 RepID=A0AA39HXU8_9BILA|nr:hypothetical protein QR680_007168 [Steinernema hermaphroditum]
MVRLTVVLLFVALLLPDAFGRKCHGNKLVNGMWYRWATVNGIEGCFAEVYNRRYHTIHIVRISDILCRVPCTKAK